MQSIYINSRGAFLLMVMRMSHEQQDKALDFSVIFLFIVFQKTFHDLLYACSFCVI